MSAKPPSPNDLDLVIDFVNTVDLEKGEERLTGSGELAAWLAERGLLPPKTELDSLDLAAALDLREALRGAMLAHNGGAAAEATDSQLEAVARRGELGVHFGPGGAVRLAPRADGPAGALAALLVPVAASVADGSWERVKACRADDCRWAFYDRSRNRSGTWCEMAVCGNRTKVRAYRERGPDRARTGTPRSA
jgi:predicted RNA-binding Zn ribbon-like protein